MIPNFPYESESLLVHSTLLAHHKDQVSWAGAGRVECAGSDSDSYGKFGIKQFVAAGGQKSSVRPRAGTL